MLDHSENRFSEILEHGLKSGGIHICASKSHGKSRLMFSMAKQLIARPSTRVLIFDGSETWLYGFDRIATFTVKDSDIIRVSENHTIEDLEQYRLETWHLIKTALEHYESLLFRLKTCKPSKRGFFTRTVINYLDEKQREQRAQTRDNEPTQYIAYFIEEAQDTFNIRSTQKLESEEYLARFNEARNNKEAFFTSSQRLSDFAKTIRSKQLYCLGKTALEDLTVFHRKLEKQHSLDFSKLAPRTWFFEGSNFVSLEWSQSGKPYQINKDVLAKFLDSLPQHTEPKINLFSRLVNALTRPQIKPQTEPQSTEPRRERTETEPKEFCEVCGKELTDDNRGTTDRELCFECESDRAHEEGLGEF